MSRKWLIALIAGAVLIPLVVFASVRGDLLKMGIDSDAESITVTKDITAGEDVVATGDVTAGDDIISTDDVTCGDDCVITGLATVGETLEVTGAVTNSSTLHTVGNETTSGTLTVTGAISGRGTLTVTGVLDANSTATLSILGEHKQRILSFSGAKTLTTAMSGAFICNQDAATTVTLTLPTAAGGLYYTLSDVEAGADNDLVITAGSGDTINGGSAAGSYTCRTDAVKQTVTLVAINATEWIVKDEIGTFVNE